MKNKNGFILSTYIYMLLVFFLLLLGTMLVVLNNTKLLSNKLKEGTQESSGLIDKDFSFILLGDKEVITRVNEEYVDAGFDAKTVKGVDLTEYVITETSVDTSVIGDYEISYKVTYNGVTKEFTRIVHVVNNVGVSYLNTLYQYKKDENGLIIDDTEDENLRYAGSNEDVKNYVEFGNDGELWRIIGVFDVASEVGGTPVPRIKLVRDSWFTNASGNRLSIVWDSSASTVNSGYGINQWGESTYEDGSYYEGADLMRLLNGYYIQQDNSCIYCTAANQETCPTTNDCKNIIVPLDNTSLNLIDNTVWKTGTVTYNLIMPLLTMYEGEHGEEAKKCSYGGVSGTNCTDKVVRTSEWKGLVGLIYASDYGYASIDVNCSNDIYGYNDVSNSCGINNWLNYGDSVSSYVTMSTYYLSKAGHVAWLVNSWRNNQFTGVDHTGVYGAHGVRPSVYLKPNVKIMGGTGTENDPYQLSL